MALANWVRVQEKKFTTVLSVLVSPILRVALSQSYGHFVQFGCQLLEFIFISQDHFCLIVAPYEHIYKALNGNDRAIIAMGQPDDNYQNGQKGKEKKPSENPGIGIKYLVGYELPLLTWIYYMKNFHDVT